MSLLVSSPSWTGDLVNAITSQVALLWLVRFSGFGGECGRTLSFRLWMNDLSVEKLFAAKKNSSLRELTRHI